METTQPIPRTRGGHPKSLLPRYEFHDVHELAAAVEKYRLARISEIRAAGSNRAFSFAQALRELVRSGLKRSGHLTKELDASAAASP